MHFHQKDCSKYFYSIFTCRTYKIRNKFRVWPIKGENTTIIKLDISMFGYIKYHYAVHPMLTHLFLSLSRSNYKNTPRKERIFRMNREPFWSMVFRSEHIRLNTAVHQPTRINKYHFFILNLRCVFFWNWCSHRNDPTCLFNLELTFRSKIYPLPSVFIG